MFIYDKDMERVMQAKKREILGELENHKLRILKELSCVDKVTLTRLREIIADYNRIEYEITARINQINQSTVEFMNLYEVKFDDVVKFYEAKINDFNGEFTELFTRYDNDLTAKYTELVNFKSEWENTLSATNTSAQETFNATNASAQETFNATNASAQELYNAFVDAKTADYNTKVTDWESRISALETQYSTKEAEWATAVDGIVSGETIRGINENIDAITKPKCILHYQDIKSDPRTHVNFFLFYHGGDLFSFVLHCGRTDVQYVGENALPIMTFWHKDLSQYIPFDLTKYKETNKFIIPYGLSSANSEMGYITVSISPSMDPEKGLMIDVTPSDNISSIEINVHYYFTPLYLQKTVENPVVYYNASATE